MCFVSFLFATRRCADINCPGTIFQPGAPSAKTPPDCRGSAARRFQSHREEDNSSKAASGAGFKVTGSGPMKRCKLQRVAGGVEAASLIATSSVHRGSLLSSDSLIALGGISGLF